MAELKAHTNRGRTGLAEAFARRAQASCPAPAHEALRENAFHTFESKGLPHRRVEEWKYTDLRALMRDAKPLAPPPDARRNSRGEIAGAVARRCRMRGGIVFVDGVFAAICPTWPALEPGLSIGSLADALPKTTRGHRASGRPSRSRDDARRAQYRADGDGAVIRIADGATIERPLHLVFVTTRTRPSRLFTRSGR